MLRSGLVTNASTGTIVANGTNSDGVVEFGAGGTLLNDGSIIGSKSCELGVEIIGCGGTVINSGGIQGYITGLEMSGSGVLINSGVIRSVTSPFIAYQADVMMTEGGSFTNTQSGLVSDGVFFGLRQLFGRERHGGGCRHHHRWHRAEFEFAEFHANVLR
ncbi:MAG TPA: hypothetical protein VFE41_17640 [Acetobacteraceae bacterium]|jgi:hypothetical protein|nr:hypothetical protein [Acetobacteraceae bacterium]